MKAIGDRLREVRGDRTLAEFAEKLGLARTTWSNYEAGRRLPSHEVMELLRRVEDVPPDRILPSAELTRTVTPTASSGWWSYIPVLWLYSRLSGEDQQPSESERLRWWSERLPSLSEEFANRAFELAEKRDLELDEAALQVCEYLSERSSEELIAFIEGSKKKS